MKEGIIIAFGEIFLKSKNIQKILRKKLEKNLSFFLKRENLEARIFPFRERIFVETKNLKKAKRVVKNVFGISWFAKSFFFDRENLKEVSEFVAKNYENWIKKGESFAIRLKKGSEIKEKRERIIEEIAKNIKRKVDLEKPKREIFVEARKEGFYLYFKKEEGLGGLPVGASGKVLTLISGGIDSPVAAYLMAKRGAENVWLHFHSFPLVSQRSIEKVKKLAQVFLKYQPHLKIYLFPFSKIQVQIRIKSPPKYRVLLYRRAMVKIGEDLAKKENCYALVTGESLGQVSSQTLPNLEIIEKAVAIPILRPLIGFDKEEIINFSKKIGTYQISILPQEDCCTLFTPKHSSAKGNLKEIEKIEKKLNLKKLIEKTKKEIQILNFFEEYVSSHLTR
jgi:thiamine biosynthesis protein ThiI